MSRRIRELYLFLLIVRAMGTHLSRGFVAKRQDLGGYVRLGCLWFDRCVDTRRLATAGLDQILDQLGEFAGLKGKV